MTTATATKHACVRACACVRMCACATTNDDDDMRLRSRASQGVKA